MAEESIVDLIKKHQALAGKAPTKPIEQPVAGPEVAPEIQKKAQMFSDLPPDRNIQATLDMLLANVKSKMAWVEIKLPSQGLLYAGGQKVVRIRPFTFEDERALKSMRAAKNAESVLDQLLRSCIDGIEVSELTPHDKVYLLYRIRGLSYGDEYPIQHDCQSCSKSNKLTINISTIQVMPLSEEMMKFTLPDSLQPVIIKLPRVQDESLFKTPELATESIPMFVHSIGGVTDKTIIESFVRKTTVRDIDTLRRKIYSPEYGMETHFFYNCGECRTKNRVEISLNENFFTAS